MCPREVSAETIVRAATPKIKVQIQLSISPSHCILTPGQAVPALTPERRAPGGVVSEVSDVKSRV